MVAGVLWSPLCNAEMSLQGSPAAVGREKPQTLFSDLTRALLCEGFMPPASTGENLYQPPVVHRRFAPRSGDGKLCL